MRRLTPSSKAIVFASAEKSSANSSHQYLLHEPAYADGERDEAMICSRLEIQTPWSGAVNLPRCFNELDLIGGDYKIREDEILKLLPLRGKYEYSFNALIKEGASNIEELLERMQVPERYPHVAVYYPENNQFETYDIIVVHYLSSSEKTIYGYQLKGGSLSSK